MVRGRLFIAFIWFFVLQLTVIGCGRLDYSFTTSDSSGSSAILTADQTNLAITEGTTVSLGVLLNKAMPTATVVRLALNGSSGDVATAFDPVPATITIPAGALSVPLTIKSRTTSIYHRTSRSYALSLACDDAGVTVGLSQVNIDLTDTKAAPTVQMATATQSVGETDGTGQVTVNLNYASAEPITISYSSANGTASSGTNYTLTAGALTIPALSTSATIPFTIIHDGLITGDLNFTASLGTITGSATLGTPTTTTVTIVDAESGTPSDPVLALSDPTTGSTSYVRQTNTAISITNDGAATKWCVSETQTTAPANGSAVCNGGAGPSGGWYTVEPTSFTLSGGDGAKTVYVWVANASDNVNASAVSDSITLDTAPPAAPTVAISDPNTGSTSSTNQSLITLSITGDAGVAKWCTIEQASASAAPSAPLYNDACFSATEPTTQSLGATGSRTVYVYVQDAAANVSTAASTATIDYQTTAPANPTLSLSDPTTGSTSYARQTTVDVAIGSDGTAVRWCLSATQTTRPASGTATCNGGAGPGDGWLTARPTSTSLPSSDGAKTLTLWVADAYNNVSASAVADTITLDTAPPATPAAALADPNTTSNSYTNQSPADISITGDTDAAKWCVIEQASAAAAPAAPLYNDACFVGSRPTTQAFGATGLRKVYVYTQDAAGNVSSAAATSSIDYETTAPADPTLALEDPNTASTTYARQTGVTIAIGNDTGIARWCVSETQTTQPALGTSTCNGGGGSSSGWYTSEPTTFTLSAGDGAKTVYVWVADAFNNVSANSVSQSITLDTTKPATPTVSLSDSVTSSTTTSYQVTADLSITADTDAVAWCVILQTDVAAAPTAPLYDDACWVGARPTTLDLAADGGRKVYVYTKDVAENVSSAAGTATITKAAVAKLSILGPFSIETNTCTQYRVVATDSSNWPSETSSALSITVSGDNGAGIYSDSGCSSTTSTVSLAKAGKVGTFYMQNASAATVTLSASATGPSTGTLTVSTTAPITGVIAMAAGPDYTCFAKSDGTVKCSGRNWRNKMLGDGSNQNNVTPVAVSGVTGAIDVKGTEFNACVLINDGTVQCWGAGWAGQLGDGNWTTSTTPVAVSSLTGVTQIGVGTLHSCALKNDGTVYCWGANYNGQLGDGTYSNAGSPVQVAGLTNAVSIMVNRATSCAVINDGTVRCWGSNGNAAYGDGTYTSSGTPVRIPGLSNVVSMSGAYDTCAVFNDETAKCWGPGWNGSLGDGTYNTSATPVSVTGLTGAIKVASSFFYNCAILRTGTAKCWGINDYGTLGDGTTTSSPTAVNVTAATGIVDMLAGGENLYHQCARLTDGSAKCWGSIAYGEGGDGVNRDLTTPTTVTGTGTATAVAAGYTHSCSIAGGFVLCWGMGWEDILGDGSYVGSYAPVTVGGVAGATDIKLGAQHACVLDGGTLKCWGANNEGELGDGTTDYHTNPPVAPSTGGAVTQFDTSQYNTCAVVGGAAMCWGGNDEGTVGDGTTTQRRVPTQVSGLTSGVSSVAVGTYHACAALSAGGIKCWGRNWGGHLGNGSTTASTSPVDVTGIAATADMLALGENHSCALISGGVKCWGAGGSGQVGNSTWADQSSPVDVTGLGSGSGVTAISAKGDTTCALMSDGSVKCWGNNSNSQLGDGTTTNSNVPVDVVGLTGATHIAVGLEHVCAEVSGAVKCWGANGRQQSGTKSWVTTPVTAVP